ncbi:pro-neuregulin-2, membrane-bound isoform-like isoform X3 [Biomphalaria glabrata]|uniref:Pro-neuregulin-2, membrane-bound isoform-like isoform X3 n=1 Tax=Biomphalaria glabrata TaxID=6526 RepID=A0A9W2ZJE1_BIOGL|nr:pro-neuregulin-2, membrane-bound isoform-like isoform X3 [Biomphalaria glabrata]
MRWFRIRLVILGIILSVVHVVNGNCKQSTKQVAHHTKTSDVVIEAKVMTMTEAGDAGQDKVNYNVSIQLKKDFYKGDALFKKHWKKNKLNLRIFSPKSQTKCLTSVQINKSYIFFLLDNGDKSGLHFELGAAPVKKSKGVTKAVTQNLSNSSISNETPPTTKKPAKKKKPPIIDSLTGPQEIKRYRIITLTCKANGTAPKVRWLKDGVLLAKSNRQRTISTKSDSSQTKSTVTISNPSHLDSGVYTCTASNSKGSDSKNFTLTVTNDWRERCPQGDVYYCYHGGTCLIIPPPNGNGSVTYLCLCPKQYSGQRCDVIDADLWSLTGQASLYHQRSLIIIGIIIAVLVFIGICIASYILAKRKRKQLEDRRKRYQTTKAQKSTITENEKEAEREKMGPSPKANSIKETPEKNLHNSFPQYAQLRRDPNGIPGESRAKEARRRLQAHSNYDNYEPPLLQTESANSNSQPAEVTFSPQSESVALMLNTNDLNSSSSPVSPESPVQNTSTFSSDQKAESAAVSTSLENPTPMRSYEAKSVQDLTRPLQSRTVGKSSDPFSNHQELKLAKVSHSNTFPKPTGEKLTLSSDSDDDADDVPYERQFSDDCDDDLQIIEDEDIESSLSKENLYTSFSSSILAPSDDRQFNKHNSISARGGMRKYPSEEAPSAIPYNCVLLSQESGRSFSLDEPSTGYVTLAPHHFNSTLVGSPDGEADRSMQPKVNHNAFDPTEDHDWDVHKTLLPSNGEEERYKLSDVLPNQQAIPI